MNDLQGYMEFLNKHQSFVAKKLGKDRRYIHYISLAPKREERRFFALCNLLGVNISKLDSNNYLPTLQLAKDSLHLTYPVIANAVDGTLMTARRYINFEMDKVKFIIEAYKVYKRYGKIVCNNCGSLVELKDE